MSVERAEGWNNEFVTITHGDCEEEAQYLADLVREKMGVENILINRIVNYSHQYTDNTNYDTWNH